MLFLSKLDIRNVRVFSFGDLGGHSEQTVHGFSHEVYSYRLWETVDIRLVRAKDVVMQMQITRTSCKTPAQRDESFSDRMILIVIITCPVPITSSRLSKDQPFQTCIKAERMLLIP